MIKQFVQLRMIIALDNIHLYVLQEIDVFQQEELLVNWNGSF